MLDPSSVVALVVFFVGVGGLAFGAWLDRRDKKRHADKSAKTSQAKA